MHLNAIKKGREKICVQLEWCNMMQYDAIWCNMMQYDAIWCNMMQYDAIWCNMMQCCCSAQLHGATCATTIRISQIRTWQELHVKTYQDTVFPLSSMISMSLLILAKHALFWTILILATQWEQATGNSCHPAMLSIRRHEGRRTALVC